MGKKSASRSGASRFWRIQELRNLELLHVKTADREFPREIHDEYEITYIERGAGYLQHGGREYLVRPDSIVVIGPGEAHRFKPSDGPWAFRTFFTAGSSLADVASSASDRLPADPRFALPVIQDKALGQSLQRLHILLEHPGCLLEQEQTAVVTGARLVLQYSRPDSSLRQFGSERTGIEHAREYLQAHYQRNVSLTKLAAIAGLSPFHFLRAFRQHVGMPPHASLVQIRINLAKKMLRDGRASVDVALTTGFSDQSHFCRHFHAHAGITPLEYRNAHHAAR